MEDYITEIFASCLGEDEVFRNRFLQLLHLEDKNTGSFHIDTQCVYAEEGKRTDLEINLGHSFIIVENKVGSSEGPNQLDAYAKLLAQRGHEKKLLLFLTANREDKDYVFPKGISFQQLRWHDVGACINETCNTITQELKKFLKAKKLIMEKINYQDLVTFQSFFGLRRKFNDVLNDVSRLYTRKGMHRWNIYQPTIRNNEYVSLFTYGKDVNVALGYGNWWGEHPCIFVRVWISHKKDITGIKAKKIHESLEGKSWDLIANQRDGYSVENKSPLIGFLQLKENQRAAIIDFFERCIDDLAEIKPDHSDIFNTSEKPVITEASE
ncbi:hypothetical protein AAE02nite_42190 [Adhaeribacter aerolatus]|uniref:PD-(D/E)XK nuclease superfamily protein n=1 Tax=Adhaeribacter aerolatus TaxID=670289 RepID=A0A512B3L4_9BACT|nr:PD-(D/E)XK nuclease family protein [Adhaeribacter aerolatus]GEO06555.1 hypothetical protein AAE02nite_42190 [Adhaeribacter aerolatus]